MSVAQNGSSESKFHLSLRGTNSFCSTLAAILQEPSGGLFPKLNPSNSAFSRQLERRATLQRERCIACGDRAAREVRWLASGNALLKMSRLMRLGSHV